MIFSQKIIEIIAISGVFLAILSLFMAIFVLLSQRKVKKKIAILFSGKEAASLESIILSHSDEISAMDKEIQDLFEISNQIHSLAQKSIHRVGIVRFNPFKDIGGDQSFALALLDGKNSGIVISSLHTREGTRIYSKPVLNGDSKKYTLTEEEKEAIEKAKLTKSKKL
jgi:hypothetical protein